jgi:hypothetical protein
MQVAHTPSTDPDVRHYRIQLFCWVTTPKPHERIQMTDTGHRKPPGGKARRMRATVRPVRQARLLKVACFDSRQWSPMPHNNSPTNLRCRDGKRTAPFSKPRHGVLPFPRWRRQSPSP